MSKITYKKKRDQLVAEKNELLRLYEIHNTEAAAYLDATYFCICDLQRIEADATPNDEVSSVDLDLCIKELFSIARGLADIRKNGHKLFDMLELERHTKD